LNKQGYYTNEQIYDIISKGYPTLELLTYPNGPKEYVTVRCKKCGHEHSCKAQTLLYGSSGCPKCDHLTKPELRKFREQLYLIKVNVLHPNVEVSGEYYNQKSIMHFKNTDCAHEWDTYADSILHNSCCPICAVERRGISQRLSNDSFVDRIKGKSPNIMLLSEYKTAKDYIDCECLVCHHKWKARGYNLHTGFGCPNCANKRVGDSSRATQAYFERRLKEAIPTAIPVGKYINSKTPVEIECGECHKIYNGIPFNLYKGEGCPYCNMPHGERMIRNYLDANNILYTFGKRYDGLFGPRGGNLSYDFYLKEYDALVEFQGEQHDHPVDKFGGQSQFEIQQEHDRLKREYASQYNIPLLEIWYYEINRIPDLLSSFISNITIPVSTTAP